MSGSSAHSPEPPLRLEGVAKRYGSVEALRDVDFHIDRGEIVGLLGDNGAGKSTLIRVMAGVVQPDSGTIRWEGRPVRLASRRDSQELGIEPIYQDAALVDTMSITRNIFMGRELAGPLGFMQMRRMRREALDVLQDVVQIGGIDSPNKLVGSLSGGQKQAVAIARAVYFRRSVLLLDEPTSALSVRTAEALLSYLRRLRDDGLASVLVTHDLYHAYQLCDRFIVMTRGRIGLQARREETTIDELTRQLSS